MTRFASTGDATTAFTLRGEGPPLLLMHGAEASSSMFDSVAALLDQRFTLIAYDQRECGATQAPAVAASLDQLAQDARLLLASLGFARAHVFGSSFGGRLAQVFAARYPECVDSLILGSTWALPFSLAELNPAGRQRLVELRSGLPDSAADLARMFFTEDFLARQPAWLNRFADVQPASAQSLRRASAVASTADVSPADIRARTLLMAGDSDRIVPPRLTLDMAAQLAHSRSILLAGVGHATCLQAPQEVARAIAAFIDGAALEGMTQP